ncbi:MAG: hypothetical protein F4Y94_08600 [Chloroflexi bacterium]|nr:hypothetical protein [Chloroflexota bacterium]
MSGPVHADAFAEAPTDRHWTVLHRADGTREPAADPFAEVFRTGAVGDWWWAWERGDDRALVLWIVVPAVRIDPGPVGPLTERGGELIRIYPNHAAGNWAQPGPVDGWDGNLEAPTLTPSIHVGGSGPNPGWHGYFEAGKLRDA